MKRIKKFLTQLKQKIVKNYNKRFSNDIFDNAKKHSNDLSWLNDNIAHAPDGEILEWDGELYIGESGQTLTLDQIEAMEDVTGVI